LVFFELLENMCHTTRAVGQTLKEKKKTIFGIFENECHTVQATGQTQKSKKRTFSVFFIFLFFL